MHAYLFEAKKLQSYIFSTGKLRDASGASELINALAYENTDGGTPSDLLGKVLGALGLPSKVKVLRRASAAVTLVSDGASLDELQQFRAAWRLAVAGHAPGLQFIDTIASDPQASPNDPVALDLCLKAAREGTLATETPVSGLNLPLASPLVRLSPRTGRVPAKKDIITGEFIDAQTGAQRAHLQQGDPTLPFLFAGQKAHGFKWPTAFTDDEKAEADDDVFPYDSERQKIAVIHADGNGVGQIFIDAGKQLTPDQMHLLSQAINRATQRAAHAASDAVFLKDAKDGDVIPARPILLGGDDLSLVTRSDLALPFTQRYLEAFESQTENAFGELRATFGKNGEFLPKCLHAKAGIVFTSAKQPFARAYELCESLASAARQDSQSRVSFWRIVSSQFEESASEVEEKMGSWDPDADNIRLWRKSWSLDGLKRLQDLVDAIDHDDVGRGALRQVPDQLANESGEAIRTYRRALDVLRIRNAQAHTGLIDALISMGLNEETPLDRDRYSPLLDAHALAQLQ